MEQPLSATRAREMAKETLRQHNYYTTVVADHEADMYSILHLAEDLSKCNVRILGAASKGKRAVNCSIRSSVYKGMYYNYQKVALCEKEFTASLKQQGYDVTRTEFAGRFRVVW